MFINKLRYINNDYIYKKFYIIKSMSQPKLKALCLNAGALSS